MKMRRLRKLKFRTSPWRDEGPFLQWLRDRAMKRWLAQNPGLLRFASEGDMYEAITGWRSPVIDASEALAKEPQ